MASMHPPWADDLTQPLGVVAGALAGVGAALSDLIGLPVGQLWQMQNGYALCTQEGLAAISALLTSSNEDVRDMLRERLAIGRHSNVKVTQGGGGQRVSQAFCSALPVAYSQLPQRDWEPFSRLMLEASYEATLLAAADQSRRGGPAWCS
jgi:hypothetical protein